MHLTFNVEQGYFMLINWVVGHLPKPLFIVDIRMQFFGGLHWDLHNSIDDDVLDINIRKKSPMKHHNELIG